MPETFPSTLELMRHCKVIPVITVHDVKHAVPLASALIAGGINVLEVTLRTPVALDAIKAMVDAKLDGLIGAGTVTKLADIEAAQSAGAEFLVSPGTPPELVKALETFKGPVFPGVSTVGEALTLRDAGYSALKFFPAEAAGGIKYLKSMAAPLPDLKFMPTGGISLSNAPDYLALPNVIAVGGSWIVPDDLIMKEAWDDITALAHQAHSLGE